MLIVYSHIKILFKYINSCSGEVFVAKQTDKRKKKKLKRVEDKILGWGNFLPFY